MTRECSMKGEGGREKNISLKAWKKDMYDMECGSA